MTSRSQRIEVSALRPKRLRLRPVAFGATVPMDVAVRGLEGLQGPFDMVLTLARAVSDPPLAQTRPSGLQAGEDRFLLTFDPATYGSVAVERTYQAQLWLRAGAFGQRLLGFGPLRLMRPIDPGWTAQFLATPLPPVDPETPITWNRTDVTFDRTDITFESGA